jgi:hypothetical protein
MLPANFPKNCWQNIVVHCRVMKVSLCLATSSAMSLRVLFFHDPVRYRLVNQQAYDLECFQLIAIGLNI